MNLKNHCIRTGKDGQLDGTTVSEIDRLVKQLKDHDKVVIHLHGGLVKESKAIAKAKELIPEYQKPGAYPIFFIYQTGLIEIIQNNLKEISKEKIFKKLVKKLLKYVVGKLTTVGGAKSAGGLDLPKDLTVAIEYKKLNEYREPFGDVKPISQLKEVTEEEEFLFKDDLVTDIDFQAEIQAIVNGTTDDQEKITNGAKGLTVSHRVSSKTLMSPSIVEEIVDDAAAKDSKGIFSTAKVVARAGAVFKRVIHRYIKKRDHRLHPTIVEEVLREFYLANIGALIWKTMKKETSDTFLSTPAEDIRGGRYFVETFGQMLKETGNRPKVTVVAHSLGSVFACNLIQHLAEARKSKQHPLPSDFKLENLIFLAPAVESDVFANTLRKYRSLFLDFRMFALDEELESGYWEVPVLYSSSLLYLVSGVCEETSDGKSAFDRPLVGMQRYHAKTKVYKSAGVKKVRQFINENANRVIWSMDNKGPGLSSDAIRHGGFDDAVFKPSVEKRRATIDSVLHIIKQGM